MEYSAAAAEKIERNDDLLMEILVRLPPKSIFKSRCVSNRWNKIIVHPYFLKSYSTKTRKDQYNNNNNTNNYCLLLPFIQLLRERKWLSMKPKLVPQRLGVFTNSSNGLILCGWGSVKHYIWDSRFDPRKKHNIYYVLNPITKIWVCLPPLPTTDVNNDIINGTRYRRLTALSCEENTDTLVPNYTVVVTPLLAEELTTMNIHIYSSKTGLWATSTLVSTGTFFLLYKTPLVWNGALHWFTADSIAVYDLHLDHRHLQLIEKPTNQLDHHCDSTLTRSEFDDVLWYGDLYNREKMQFWMLPKNNKDDKTYRRSSTIPANEWVLMHTITTRDEPEQAGPLMLFLENYYDFEKKNRSQSEYYFSLEALIPYNHTKIVAVLRSGERLYIYNFESKSLIETSAFLCSNKSTSWWYPYMATPYLSSYALRPRAV